MADIEEQLDCKLSASAEVQMMAEALRERWRLEYQGRECFEVSECFENINGLLGVSGTDTEGKQSGREHSESPELVKREAFLGWSEVDMDLERYLIDDARANNHSTCVDVNGRIGGYKLPVETVSRAVATMPLSYILKSAYDHVILVDYLLSNPQFRPNGDQVSLVGCSPSEIVISLLEEQKVARLNERVNQGVK